MIFRSGPNRGFHRISKGLRKMFVSFFPSLSETRAHEGFSDIIAVSGYENFV